MEHGAESGKRRAESKEYNIMKPCRLGSCPLSPRKKVEFSGITGGVGRRGGTTRSEACAKPNITCCLQRDNSTNYETERGYYGT